MYARCDTIRRKNSTLLGLDIKTSKTQSSDRTSPGGVLLSVSASATAVRDKSHTGLYDPMAEYRTPPTRLSWPEDLKIYGKRLDRHGEIATGAGIIVLDT